MSTAYSSLLAKTALFKDLPHDILDQLSDTMQELQLPNGAEVIRQGDIGETMYVIVDGKVKVHDKEHTVAELSSGDFMGEMSLIDAAPRSLSVTAISPCHLISLDKKTLFDFIADKPLVTRNLLISLATRLRKLDDTVIAQFRSREKELTQLVEQRTEELREHNDELTTTLEQLQRTQQQLVLREKLASLGEMSAGIAHEIQNPLNFINNFSILSQSLIEDFLTSTDEEEKEEILNDLKGNMEKINHHGKRADSIVRGMLQHNRMDRSVKQLSDINAICTEAMTLSYHSFQARYTDYACGTEFYPDPSLPNIEVYSQELIKVVVNILNNAFYSTREQGKLEAAKNVSFHPRVALTTSMSEGSIWIKVKDNGTGIPEANISKVFQPFFTTKPTGEGTGLGMSISFDMITAHGGTINIESAMPGETIFAIGIPM